MIVESRRQGGFKRIRIDHHYGPISIGFQGSLCSCLDIVLNRWDQRPELVAALQALEGVNRRTPLMWKQNADPVMLGQGAEGA